MVPLLEKPWRKMLLLLLLLDVDPLCAEVFVVAVRHLYVHPREFRVELLSVRALSCPFFQRL